MTGNRRLRGKENSDLWQRAAKALNCCLLGAAARMQCTGIAAAFQRCNAAPQATTDTLGVHSLAFVRQC